MIILRYDVGVVGVYLLPIFYICIKEWKKTLLSINPLFRPLVEKRHFIYLLCLLDLRAALQFNWCLVALNFVLFVFD